MSLDIIIPAHDEERRIGATLRSYRRGFPEPSVRFLVALDDCRDSTAAIVAVHASSDPRVEVHVFPKLGKGGVIKETAWRCSADLIAFVDADGATSPKQLARLVRSIGQTDGAIASRRLPGAVLRGHRSPGRVLVSAVFAWLVPRIFRLPYRDIQCGAKVLRREVMTRLLPLVSTPDLLFDLDLLLIADRLGYRLVEVPTVWFGKPGSRVRLMRDWPGLTISLLRLWARDRGMQPLPGGRAQRSPQPSSRAA